MFLFRHQRRKGRCSRPLNVPGRATYSSVFSTAWRIHGHISQTCSSIVGRQVHSRIQVVPFALEFGHFHRNGNSEALTESRLACQEINKCPELGPTAPNRETRVYFSSAPNILLGHVLLRLCVPLFSAQIHLSLQSSVCRKDEIKSEHQIRVADTRKRVRKMNVWTKH